MGTPIEIPSIMPIDSPSVESSIEDSDSDENQTEILLNNSKNEEKMRIFLERNYSALKSIFLDGNFQNDKHNRGSLTLSPMGSNPTDFLWGGHMAPPMYLENQRSSGLDFWQVSCPDYLLSKNTQPTLRSRDKFADVSIF